MPETRSLLTDTKKPGRRPGKWLVEFKEWMRHELDRAEPSTNPLPTTRELADQFGVNNSTVFRQFVKYEEAGALWRSEGGRFYDARVRGIVEKPRPIACLLRRIENWSFLYQEWMEGIAIASEEAGRATLLWHDENLVRHQDVEAPPAFASPQEQIKSLASFFCRYGHSIGGLILDQIWCDEALATIPLSIRRKSVVLGRPGPPDIVSVVPDWKQSATLAIAKLQAKGCRAIHPVRPFDNDPAINHALACIQAAAREIEYPLSPEQTAATRADRTKLISALVKSKKTVGVLVPEDNIAQLLSQEARARGLSHLHILSIQGTRHSSETPRIRTDYAALGRQAVATLTAAPESDRNPSVSRSDSPLL